MQKPRVVLEWGNWRLVHWQERGQYSVAPVGRSCLETRYTDRLGDPSWREAEAFEAAFKALASDLAARNSADLDTARPQQDPKPGSGPPIVNLLCDDLQSRAEAGRQKYGRDLQAHNGRDAIVDAYQEALDLAMYLRQAIEERGG